MVSQLRYEACLPNTFTLYLFLFACLALEAIILFLQLDHPVLRAAPLVALEGVRAVVPVLASELPGNIADLARFLPSNAGNALPCGYTEATSARAQPQPAHGRRACPRARRPFGFALACRGPALF